jgi:hypothetical protein
MMIPLLQSGPRRLPASAQEVTIDLLWIRDGVVAFAGARRSSVLYRAVLALEGPAHTPRSLAGSNPGALEGYRAALHLLDHALQVVVLAGRVDDAAAAGRWEARAGVLPEPLATLAREHAAWARREMATLDLLLRRAFLVLPAEDPIAGRSPVAAVRRRLRRDPAPGLTLDRARAVLAERCGRLAASLGAAGVRTRRLDDLALARLYRGCWSPTSADGDRSDRDLVDAFGSGRKP